MLEVSGLTVVFTRDRVNRITAVNDLSISLAPGDYVTLIGSNGAGKSTLLNALAGAVPIQSGSITLDGTNITRWPDYRRATLFARVFQDPLGGTAASLLVEENMALAAARGRSRGLRKAVTSARRNEFRNQLSQLGIGLDNRLGDSASLLSGGQRQSLTVTMATIVEPKVLLLDEHVSALDPRTQAQVMRITDQLITQSSLMTLMVTHNLEHALRYGNRLIMMHEGRIVLDLAGDAKRECTVESLLGYFRQRDVELSDSLILGRPPTED